MNDDLAPMLREFFEHQKKETFVDKLKNALPLILAVVSMFAFVWTLRADATSIAAQVKQIEKRLDKMEADMHKRLDALTISVQTANDVGIRLQERHHSLQLETDRLRQSCCK